MSVDAMGALCIVFGKSTTTLIVGLHLVACPSAIAWLVVSVVVDSVNGVSTLRQAHVGDEVL